MTLRPPLEEEETVELRWWSPEPQGLQSEEEDEEENRYHVNLLTGGLETGSNDSELTPSRTEAATAPVTRDCRALEEGSEEEEGAPGKMLIVVSHLQRKNLKGGCSEKRRCVASRKNGRLRGETHG